MERIGDSWSAPITCTAMMWSNDLHMECRHRRQGGGSSSCQPAAPITRIRAPLRRREGRRWTWPRTVEPAASGRVASPMAGVPPPDCGSRRRSYCGLVPDVGGSSGEAKTFADISVTCPTTRRTTEITRDRVAVRDVVSPSADSEYEAWENRFPPQRTAGPSAPCIGWWVKRGGACSPHPAIVRTVL